MEWKFGARFGGQTDNMLDERIGACRGPNQFLELTIKEISSKLSPQHLTHCIQPSVTRAEDYWLVGASFDCLTLTLSIV